MVSVFPPFLQSLFPGGVFSLFFSFFFLPTYKNAATICLPEILRTTGIASGETLGEDSACAKLRLELDALKNDSEIKCLALERRVRLCLCVSLFSFFVDVSWCDWCVRLRGFAYFFM